MNRLDHLLTKYVRVTGDSGATWEGTLVALANEPVMVIDREPRGLEDAFGGPHRMVLPQRFNVEELTVEQRIAEAVRTLSDTDEGRAYAEKIMRDVQREASS